MRFDLKDQAITIAQINNASIFARANQDAGACGGKLLEQGARIFVAAVLRPHNTKHGQFVDIRLPTQALFNEGIFGGGEATRFQFRRAVGHGSALGGLFDCRRWLPKQSFDWQRCSQL